MHQGNPRHIVVHFCTLRQCSPDLLHKPKEFWLYVVENARNLDVQLVSALPNPFAKVDEYWFDHEWRDACEERATAQDINVRVGANVWHGLWQTGTIIEVVGHGIGRSVKVDFGYEGIKLIPLSKVRLVD